MDTAKVIDQNGHDVAEPVPAKRPRFVTPTYRDLPLTDGDWIKVKEQVTYGEQKQMATAGLTDMMEGEAGTRRIGMDFSAFERARLLGWVVEWSFNDERGRRVPVTKDTIDALDPDTADEIIAALDLHVEEMAARKNAQSSGPA